MTKENEENTVSAEQFAEVQTQLAEATSKMTELTNKNSELSEQLGIYKGVDLTKIEEDRQKLRDLQTQSAGGNPEQINQMVEERVNQEKERFKSDYGSKITDLEERLGARNQELKELKVVDRAFGKVSTMINEDVAEDIKNIIRRDVDMVEGNLVVKDSEGNIRLSRANPKSNMSLDEYISELKTARPSYFRPEGKSGAGQPNQNRTTGGNGGSSALDSIDNKRFVEDDNYRRSLDPKIQYAKAKQLGL